MRRVLRRSILEMIKATVISLTNNTMRNTTKNITTITIRVIGKIITNMQAPLKTKEQSDRSKAGGSLAADARQNGATVYVFMQKEKRK